MRTSNSKKGIDGVVRKSVPQKVVKISTSQNLTFSLKTTAGFMLLLIALTTSLSFGSTIAHYRDREISSLNKFISNPLSFSVEIASSSSATVDLTSGGALVLPIMTPDPGSQTIQYKVSALVTGGDSGLCNAIKLLGTFPFPYDNNLNLLDTSTTTQTGSWAMNFSLSDPSTYSNTFCTVDLVYRGYSDSKPFGQGYTDEEKLSLTFNVSEILLLRSLNFGAQAVSAESLENSEGIVVEEPQEEVEPQEAESQPDKNPDTVIEETEEVVEDSNEPPTVVTETPEISTSSSETASTTDESTE